MPSTREMRLRIKSIKNIAQVTKAMETVSASKVRKSTQLFNATKTYSSKAWEVLTHLALQTTGEKLHPLLSDRKVINNVVVLILTSDRGLAGAYNLNVVSNTQKFFESFPYPLSYLTVGREGRDFLRRRRKKIIAEFSNIPSPPSFLDISPIGRMAVNGFLSGEFDEVYISYTEFINMVRQDPVVHKILPLDIEAIEGRRADSSDSKELQKNKQMLTNSVYIYEPEPIELLSEIVPRFLSMQIYQSILSSQASEHAARMIAMRNATENARELITVLQLEYNKVRQQIITNEMLDIVGGVEAMSKATQVTP